MKIVILGAGRPYRGDAPTSLTPLARAKSALDWQLSTFGAVADDVRAVFIGGYGLEQIAPKYPQLYYVAAPDWATSNALSSLLRAPLGAEETVVTYADTVFHEAALTTLLAEEADVVFGYDSEWRERYPHRSPADIEQAERIVVQDGTEAEFTGLLRLGPDAVDALSSLTGAARDGSLLDLLEHFRASGLHVSGVDLAHQWAEFNDPRDIARFVLGTKAETLARLEGRLEKGRIEPQVSFSVAQWEGDRAECLARIGGRFTNDLVIVRSSSASEDDWSNSAAGTFLSTGGVTASDTSALESAIEAVIASYGACLSKTADQVLVQRHVCNVAFAGVALTCGLSTGSPYYRINLESGGGTDIVTAGREGHLRTVIIVRDHPARLAGIDPALMPVLDAICEVERLIAWEKLDIEFAVDAQANVHIFQIRPLVVDQGEIRFDTEEFDAQLALNIAQFERLQMPPSGMAGSTTIFGVMPDWNPAEIIGTRPRPLALDLYRRLVTDNVWALQRAEYGYRDVRPVPLLASFSGQPFVDVRASLNSFLPASLPKGSANRLVDAQLAILAANPALHDKIEFDVAMTIWIPDILAAARERYAGHDVRDEDLHALADGLKGITRQALLRLKEDIVPIETLTCAHAEIEATTRAPGDRAVQLIESCARYGTPAFAHAARAGFISVALLRNMVETGALHEERRQLFLQGLDTVSRQLQTDNAPMPDLIDRFGHLRPGTYEITARAYWEDPETYFADRVRPAESATKPFVFEGEEIAWCEGFLEQLGCPIDVPQFTQYLRTAIEMRERVKFDFTRTLSRALDLWVEAAPGWGLNRDDLSYLKYADLREMVFGAGGGGHAKRVIEINRAQHRLSLLTEMPPVLRTAEDFLGFEHAVAEPNFITLERALGPAVDAHEQDARLEGAIVLAPRADPGFDWLFSQKIAGLVTRYGGGNSHMAIRAAELGIPAVIGVGDLLFESISSFGMVELDCAQRTIREI